MRRWSFVLSALMAATALAHGGEEHAGDAPAVASTQGEMHVLGASGEVFEVVLKHPAHGEGGKTPLRVFVAELDTNAPVAGAQVELTLTGPTTQALAPKMESPGVYRAEAELPVEAEFAAVATVTRGQTVDVLALGTVHLEHEEEAAGSHAGGASGPWLLAGVGLVALALGAWAVARRARRVAS
ncbi:hypothetical protein [Hyalangium rubrum]|uniref:YtkA-like domain-containing protein n=1 Tax=Hyalangium rubrum TaxID=3103134 RepID=A0ABU5H1E3_9BACT|nr:hypothetical protein [Hyalangium sp. s54d21]MDY7227131.1 hypothetical protein [Hyalangium sp. s54d21]